MSMFRARRNGQIMFLIYMSSNMHCGVHVLFHLLYSKHKGQLRVMGLSLVLQVFGHKSCYCVNESFCHLL